MTARTRARPRSSRAPRQRRRKSFFSGRRLLRREAVGIAMGALAVAVVLVTVDVPGLLADVRDGIARTFGVGALIILALGAGAGVAIWRGALDNRRLFAQKATGAVALGAFFWGAMALNEAHWQLGSVNFHQVTLGGRLGAALISGFLGKVAWLSLFIIGMAMLAPSWTRSFAERAPLWIEHAWQERWPHRAAAATGRVLALLARPRNGSTDDSFVIGADALTGAGSPAAQEDAPVIYRPQIDLASPSSTLGIGAAIHFAPLAAAVSVPLVPPTPTDPLPPLPFDPAPGAPSAEPPEHVG